MAHVGQHRPQSVARACRQAAPAAEEGFPNAADLTKYTETPPWHKDFAARCTQQSPFPGVLVLTLIPRAQDPFGAHHVCDAKAGVTSRGAEKPHGD